VDTLTIFAAHSPTPTPHAVLRDYLQELPEPLVPFAAYTSVMDAALEGKAGNEAQATEHTTDCVSQHAQRRIRQTLQAIAAQPAHTVTLRRLLRFLHRHIFLLPMRCAEGGEVSQGTNLPTYTPPRFPHRFSVTFKSKGINMRWDERLGTDAQSLGPRASGLSRAEPRLALTRRASPCIHMPSPLHASSTCGRLAVKMLRITMPRLKSVGRL
jgi:hypothetical protein